MILLTGGSGLLGTEIQKHLLCYAPSHKDFDIIDPPPLPEGIHMIVHCAAYTDVAGAEINKQECFDTNAVGTYQMAKMGVPVVYISTEYVFDGELGDYTETCIPNPINYYAVTKFFGEELVRKAEKSLTIRCLFKPRPFPHPKACTDQWTSGDYVDVIAPMVVKAIHLFEKMPQGNHVLHIGTEKKTTYELARQSRDVQPCSINDIDVRLPKDTSLDLTKWKELSGEDR
jgi:dTDP-4-dehydrorhamnose reductase